MAQLTTKLETITPQRALQYLELAGEKNRTITDDRVVQLAAVIVGGQWELTHQGIAFDRDGKLVDGRHRLSAIVRADQPVSMMVTRGIGTAAFEVLDTGKVRTATDVLGMEGVTSASYMAATARQLIIYLMAPRVAQVRARQVTTTNRSIALFVEKNVDLLLDAVRQGRQMRGAGARPTSASVGLALGGVYDEEWCEGLRTGAELKAGDARLVLRNTWQRLASNRQYLKPNEFIWLYVTARNAYLKGDARTMLRGGVPSVPSWRISGISWPFDTPTAIPLD